MIDASIFISTTTAYCQQHVDGGGGAYGTEVGTNHAESVQINTLLQKKRNVNVLCQLHGCGRCYSFEALQQERIELFTRARYPSICLASLVIDWGEHTRHAARLQGPAA